MSRLERALQRVVTDLATSRARFAVVGALGVSARSEPRFTRDVDLAVSVEDDAQAEALVRSLQELGYGIGATVEQEIAGRLATVRLSLPGADRDSVVVDLLFASSGIEPEVVAAAENLDLFPGLEVPVARTGHLIALKLLARDSARRPQDQADLVALLDAADRVEIERARQAVATITARGYHRQRNLAADLESLLLELDS